MRSELSRDTILLLPLHAMDILARISFSKWQTRCPHEKGFMQIYIFLEAAYASTLCPVLGTSSMNAEADEERKQFAYIHDPSRHPIEKKLYR